MSGHHPSSNNLTVLDYPLNIGNQVANGEHYMMIDSYESVNALVSRPNKKSSIALYIPPNSLKTAFGASYEGLDSGATKAKIKSAFVKSLKTKKLNKKVLGEFIELVA